jgi:hypothetical protein
MQHVLGILGARNSLSKQILQDEILTPILDDLGKKPTKILLPSEPLSSTFIECWAARNAIITESMKSDWVQHGKRAGIMRDAAIEKGSTALLVFEGPRSRYMLDLAERIAKRRPECRVYVVEAKSVSPVLLEVDQATRYMISDEVEQEILKPAKAQKSNKGQQTLTSFLSSSPS